MPRLRIHTLKAGNHLDVARPGHQVRDLAGVEFLRTGPLGDAGDDLVSERLHVEQLEDRRTYKAQGHHGLCAAEAQNDYYCHLRVRDRPEKSAAGPEYS